MLRLKRSEMRVFCAGTPHIVKAILVVKFLPNKAHFVFAPQLRHCRAVPGSASLSLSSGLP